MADTTSSHTPTNKLAINTSDNNSVPPSNENPHFASEQLARTTSPSAPPLANNEELKENIARNTPSLNNTNNNVRMNNNPNNLSFNEGNNSQHTSYYNPSKTANLNASYAYEQQQKQQQQYAQFQQRHNQQQQQNTFGRNTTIENTISLTNLSEKYANAFRSVDDRICNYLSRFLRRAKQGPEQERQLLQVIQVEIRDLMRRTLDAEAETIQVGELLRESSLRLEETTKNADIHLERVLAGQEERVRELKIKNESIVKEKALEIESRFKRDKQELEERVVFAEAEMNHRLKTNILETEQRVHAQHAESNRELKKQAREMATANEQYKHQLSSLTAELQAERRSYLELQESMGLLKTNQAEERLKVQQQLMDVVQTWEREARSREEIVRNEMEKGFLMRLSAEKELFDRQRVSELKLQKERLEVEHSKASTMLKDKMDAMKKNEVLESKVKYV